MGTGFDTVTSEEEQGIIPRAIAHLFRGIDERKRRAQERGVTGPEFKVSAQFLEVLWPWRVVRRELCWNIRPWKLEPPPVQRNEPRELWRHLQDPSMLVNPGQRVNHKGLTDALRLHQYKTHRHHGTVSTISSFCFLFPFL